MTSIYDLPQDLVEEIFSRVQIASRGAIRSTCKLWNTLSKDPSSKLCVKAAKDIMVITMHDGKACLMSVNFHNHRDLVDPFIKQIGKLKQFSLWVLFYCNGWLLCVANEHTESMRLVVWNPFTGQTRWFEPGDYYLFRNVYGMGYDNNNHHKILRIFYLACRRCFGCDIYDFKTNSWRALDVTIDGRVCGKGVSLKGNNYFITQGLGEEASKNRLLCFDFTRERFCSVPLPCSTRRVEYVVISAVTEEKLGVLYRMMHGAPEMQIWITNKIDEPDEVSWSYFLKVDKIPVERFLYIHVSFLVDEKKKEVVIFDANLAGDESNKAYLVGEGGYYRKVDLGKSTTHPFICYSYVPSLVHIQ